MKTIWKFSLHLKKSPQKIGVKINIKVQNPNLLLCRNTSTSWEGRIAWKRKTCATVGQRRLDGNQYQYWVKIINLTPAINHAGLVRYGDIPNNCLGPNVPTGRADHQDMSSSVLTELRSSSASLHGGTTNGQYFRAVTATGLLLNN